MSKSSFLPFIKKTSSEESIFKAILQRTKGSSTTALTNIFSVVLGAGVENVRAKIDSLDDNLTTSAKISEVVAQETEHHIPLAEREFWLHASKYNTEKTSNFTKTEQEIYLTVLAVHSPNKLIEAGFLLFSEKYENLKEYSKETCELGINDVPGVSITEDSKFRTGFTCWEEFKAYLAMKADSEGDTKVSPVFIKTTATDVTAHIYAENHCLSPYAGNKDET